MQSQAGRGSGFDLALGVWSRRKGLAVLVFAGTFTGVAGIVRFLPDMYRATATVLVERQQVPESFVKPSVTGELETRLQTISQEILSRTRLVDLITRFDLYPGLRKRLPAEAVINRMRRDIQLEPKAVDQAGGRGATVAFALSYRGRDPETVARVTNTLASFFVAENLAIREQQATGTTEFLKQQLAEAKLQLEEQRRRVEQARLHQSFTVSVLGYVKNPGQYEVRNPATVLDVLAQAGGFTDFASPRRIVVLRAEGSGRRRIPFNYNKVVALEEQNLPLRPGDIVVVPTGLW